MCVCVWVERNPRAGNASRERWCLSLPFSRARVSSFHTGAILSRRFTSFALKTKTKTKKHVFSASCLQFPGSTPELAPGRSRLRRFSLFGARIIDESAQLSSRPRPLEGRRRWGLWRNRRSWVLYHAPSPSPLLSLSLKLYNDGDEQ